MASDVATIVAETILADWDGDGHWKQAENLACYLAGHYVPGQLKHEMSEPVAQSIIDDLNGAGRFRDVAVLAEHVDAEMAKIVAAP